MDGDPLSDFDTLVNTVTTIRGGVPYEQRDLLDAWSGTQSHPQGAAAHWHHVSRQQRRDGCCDLGH
ncbi:hypothetical protein STAL104432_12150 [Streptomyces albus]